MVRLIKERELIKDKQFKAVKVLEVNSMERVCSKIGCETLDFEANNIAYYSKDTKTEKVTYEVHRSLKRGE
jgi:RNA-binding protein YhbY